MCGGDKIIILIWFLRLEKPAWGLRIVCSDFLEHLELIIVANFTRILFLSVCAPSYILLFVIKWGAWLLLFRKKKKNSSLAVAHSIPICFGMHYGSGHQAPPCIITICWQLCGSPLQLDDDGDDDDEIPPRRHLLWSLLYIFFIIARCCRRKFKSIIRRLSRQIRLVPVVK